VSYEVRIPLPNLRLDDMAPIAGVVDAPNGHPSALANLWASVLLLALYDATDSVASRQRDEARWYLTMRNADLRLALDGAGLDQSAFEDHIGHLAASGWRVTEQWRRQLRLGLEREPHVAIAIQVQNRND
jgi:hypothetical protein